MELIDLFNETAAVRAEYKGRVFVMQAYTEKLTPEYKAQLLLLAVASAEENKETKEESCLMLSGLIESWKGENPETKELEEITVDGKPFPATYDNLLKLSFHLIATLIRAVTTFLGDQANPTSATN